jgi:TolB-like protein
MKQWLIVAMLIWLNACAMLSAWGPRPPQGDALLLGEAYRAADVLHTQLRDTEARQYPILVAAFVDSANVEDTSQVGRLVAEQVASRLGQLGYQMKDIQLRAHSVAVRPSGVLALSRRLEEIAAEADAHAVLVGTYTAVGSRFFMNVRVVRSADSVVLAAADMELPAKALIPSPRLPQRVPSVETRLQGGL